MIRYVRKLTDGIRDLTNSVRVAVTWYVVVWAAIRDQNLDADEKRRGSAK